MGYCTMYVDTIDSFWGSLGVFLAFRGGGGMKGGGRVSKKYKFLWIPLSFTLVLWFLAP